MSSQGNTSTARRVTRASSRGVASREGSVDDASVIGDAPATPARSTRARTRGTPSKETSRDVGNRGSTAYGAKGKAFSGSSISAEQANLSPADLLQQEVEKAHANHIRAARQASQLPPVVEEDDSDSQPSSTPRSPSASLSQSSEEEENQAQGRTGRLPSTRPNANTSGGGTATHASLVEDSSVLERTLISRLPNPVGLWLNLRGARGAPQANPIRQAGTARGVRGYEEDYDNAELNIAYPEVVAWPSQVALGLLLIICMLLLDLYRGPLLGAKYDFMRGRFHKSPVNTNPYVSNQVYGRLSALEKLVDRIASRSYSDHDVAPEVQQINWFSPGLGAQIVPRLTSPAHVASCKHVPFEELGWWDQLTAKVIGSEGRCLSNVPGVALRPWFDIDDRFCAPPSKGKLQLTVITNRQIAPTELVLEYPKDALPEKGNVPREMELWAEVHNIFTQQNIAMAYDGIQPPGESQVDHEVDAENALPSSFVLIGRWKYDLHSRNHVQTFRIPVDLKALGVKSNRLAVRVNTNWGDATATCLYRVKLHGHDMSEQKEFLMDPLPSGGMK